MKEEIAYEKYYAKEYPYAFIKTLYCEILRKKCSEC